MRAKSKPNTRSERFVLDDDAFAKISAVEGFNFTPEMDAMFRAFDRDGTPPDARRREIIRRYARNR